MKGICPKCGCRTFILTEIYKAMCEFQYLIDNGVVCLNCIKDDHPEVVLTLGHALMHPAKHGKDCPQKGPDCFLGRLDLPATSDDDDYDDQCGPTDLRDDWPHARPVPEGVRLST